MMEAPPQWKIQDLFCTSLCHSKAWRLHSVSSRVTLAGFTSSSPIAAPALLLHLAMDQVCTATKRQKAESSRVGTPPAVALSRFSGAWAGQAVTQSWALGCSHPTLLHTAWPHWLLMSSLV